jgi:hypothetical protein
MKGLREAIRALTGKLVEESRKLASGGVSMRDAGRKWGERR